MDEPKRSAVSEYAVPCSLFHVTTGKKVKAYRQTGRINAPVRLLGQKWRMA